MNTQIEETKEKSRSVNGETSQDANKLSLDAFLSEYSHLREELLQRQKESHELCMYALISIGGIATLVVTLANTNNSNLLVSVLLVLPLPFAALLFAYLGSLNQVMNIGQYLADHIEPNVGRILRSPSLQPIPVPQWHAYISTKARGIWSLGSTIGALGQLALILLPLLGSLFAYFFVQMQTQFTPNNWQLILLVLDFALIGLALFAVIVTAARAIQPIRRSKQ